MKRKLWFCALAMAGMAAAGTQTRADFAGQPIFGPIGPGSVVTGDTTGHADDNDGFTSGMHIFDIWLGPDDVWQLDWPGGDLKVELFYDNTFADLELFVYRPSNLDDSGDYSAMNSGIETVEIPAAVAGAYYINIDSPDAGTAGAYTLAITPEPGMLALLGVGAAVVIRRRS